MRILDNFLKEQEINNITNIMSDIPWYYTDSVIKEEEKLCADFYQHQLFHIIYNKVGISSRFFQYFEPMLEYMNCRALSRIKANLLLGTDKIYKHGFHVDNDWKDSTTAIFYVNTNNGYTEFDNGTKVESIANRLVIFPSYLKHTGTTCTDQKTRFIVNFNYF